MTDRRPLLTSAESPPPAGPPPDAEAPQEAGAPLEPAAAPAAPPAAPPPPSTRLRFGHYLILISLNSIGAFSSDCYIPNLSDIVDDLNANDQMVSLTIQINWVLLGLATPFVGHLSDVHGRKLVVCLTLVAYVAGALGSALAPSIEWLLVARCVQGVGEACSIITSAIIRDVVDDPQERMRIQAYFTTMRPLMLLGATAATPSPPSSFPTPLPHPHPTRRDRPRGGRRAEHRRSRGHRLRLAQPDEGAERLGRAQHPPHVLYP